MECIQEGWRITRLYTVLHTVKLCGLNTRIHASIVTQIIYPVLSEVSDKNEIFFKELKRKTQHS